MNPYHGRTSFKYGSGHVPILIGVTDHWKGQHDVSTSGAKLYAQQSDAYLLPGLRCVASVLEEEDFDVPMDRSACHD